MNSRQYSEKKKKPSVGFIGMGHMGSAMAQRLLEAGYLLTIYDRTPARGQPLAEQGASVAQSPRDVAAQCEVVMACVTDDRAQESVMLGSGRCGSRGA